MPKTFKVGELVMLNSGGPKMTVSKLPDEYADPPRITCTWFAGAKLTSGRFEPEILIKLDALAND